MSPKAKASEYVTYEWAFAWGAGIRVIPVLYKETILHPRLEALHHLNFTGSVRPWNELINTLKKIAATIPTTPPLILQDNIPPLASTQQQTTSHWLETGNKLLEREDFEEALDAYKQAILLDINNASAYAGKSRALSGLKHYQEALAASNQSIRLDSTCAIAWYSKGVVLSRLNRHDDALAAFEETIGLDSTFARAWYNKGASLSKLKRHDEAKQAFDKAKQLGFKV